MPLKQLVPFLIFLFIVSCTSESKKQETPPATTETKKPFANIPDFNPDSALAFVQKQVDFGPRVPGTAAHAKCAAWIAEKCKAYGLTTQTQTAPISTFDGKKYQLKNIIAEYKPEKTKRILLCTHWDTRPWADRDTVDKYKPFDGANDGGSGVGVLLEIARLLQLTPVDYGVDFVFFDLEDYGQDSNDDRYPEQQNTWCLGSQFWAKNLHKPNYFAQYGILLDMVGAYNPQFPKEGTGMYYASDITNKVWNIAQTMGYGQFFTNATAPQTTDDHLYVNLHAGIKCIDIVHYEMERMAYFKYHHTHGDNMQAIDKNVLQITGRVLLQTLFEEKSGS
jgi:glutaminyl-peptide cyclotransferase